MTVLAHAIALAPPATFSHEGLRGRPLVWTEAAEGLGLWGTEWRPDQKLERRDALEHHGLVERICGAQPCLPVRFGTVFGGPLEARASLDQRSVALRAALARVAGMSELALTLLWRELSPTAELEAAAGPGRRYMEARRAEHVARGARRARAEALVERVITELAIERPFVWHQTCASADVAASLAVLVPTEAAPERKAELTRIAEGFTDVAPVVNGPWPPYTFAAIE